MTTIQKIQDLAKRGNVNIRAQEFENERGKYTWYFVSFEDSQVEINSEMPTLDAAVSSVHIQVCNWQTNINMKYETWKNLLEKRYENGH